MEKNVDRFKVVLDYIAKQLETFPHFCTSHDLL